MLRHADLLIDAHQYAEALQLYNHIVANAEPASHLLQRRGWLRRLSGDFDGAVADYDRAIALSPDDATLYCDRGACLAHRMSSLQGVDRPEKSACLEQIVADYRAAVERDPANASAWLALVEVRLLQHDWDGAIADYALCRLSINSEQYQLVRAWLGGLATCLSGDPVEREDLALLLDKGICLHHTSWCVAEIESLLDELAEAGMNRPALANARELHELFLGHFDEAPIRAMD